MRTTRTAVALAFLLPAAAASARQPEDQTPPPASLELPGNTMDWEFRVVPRAWFAALGGDLRLPGGSGEVEIDLLDLDEPSVRPYIDLEFRRERWKLRVSAAYIDEDASTRAGGAGAIGSVAFDAGDQLTSGFELLTFEGSAAYQLWIHRGARNDAGLPNLESILEIAGGMRFTHIDAHVEARRGRTFIGRTSDEQLFAEPTIGVHWTLGLHNAFTIEAGTNLGIFPGSDHSSFSWDITAQAAYRPTGNLGVLFGYRQLLGSYDDGDDDDGFEYTGAAAGLYAGVELRF